MPSSSSPQLPFPVSLQIFNLFPGYDQPTTRATEKEINDDDDGNEGENVDHVQLKKKEDNNNDEEEDDDKNHDTTRTATTATTTTTAKRLDYSIQLLRPVQASIVEVMEKPIRSGRSKQATTATAAAVGPSNPFDEEDNENDDDDVDNNNNNGNGTLDDRIWYTFPMEEHEKSSLCATTCPSWTHLSEVLAWDRLHRATFERMHMRFTVMPTTTPINNDDDSTKPASSSSSSSSSTYFLQIPLHPSKLIPLSRELPTDRPINTVVVHFSDESKRITPHVLEQFKKQQQKNSNLPPVVADEQLLRFEENAFQALDTVGSSSSSRNSPITAPTHHNGSTSNLLDAAQVLEPDMSAASSSLSITATSTEVSVDVLPSPGSAEVRFQQEVSNLPLERSVRVEDLIRQRDLWQQRIVVAQAAVESEKQICAQEQACLRQTLQFVRTKQEQAVQINKAIQEERRECQRLTLQLEAQKIRLLKELRQLYPIWTEGNKVGKIRGLTLPRDLFSIPEDDISAALGFLCHTVTMLSRYLAVPLRYRLYCNSSRSAIQDDRGTVFPLFQARHIEREQLEYGVLLLERNVECIGHSRGLVWTGDKASLHVLDKVNMIYRVTIEGE